MQAIDGRDGGRSGRRRRHRGSGTPEAGAVGPREQRCGVHAGSRAGRGSRTGGRRRCVPDRGAGQRSRRIGLCARGVVHHIPPGQRRIHEVTRICGREPGAGAAPDRRPGRKRRRSERAERGQHRPPRASAREPTGAQAGTERQMLRQGPAADGHIAPWVRTFGASRNQE